MLRTLVLLVAAAGAVAARQRLQAQRAEQELWAEITDVPDRSESSPG